MKTIELPGGQRAEFLEIDDVTGKMRKTFFEMIKDIPAVDTPNYGIAFFIRAWSLEVQLPNAFDVPSVEALEDLPVRVLDAMSRHVAQLIEGMTPNFDPDPDPASPTSPSGD